MIIEPVTRKQLDHLILALGLIGSMLCDLHDADLSRGRGILKGNDRCLWTKDGRRITISLGPGGEFIASCGNEPDPEAPEQENK
jgi:hypothetical protein